jgi:hypothetical protein
MIRLKPALALTLVLIEITSCLEIAQAQFSPSIQVVSEPPPPVGSGPPHRDTAGTEVQPPPPVDGAPPEREPAGTRGSCEKTNQPFTPLLPVTKSGFSGYTLTEHPTFWFYVPYKTNSISSGKFSLEDEEGNTFYRTSFKLPNTPGFVSISIPTTEKPLEKNKQYRWTFTLYCASQDPSELPRVWHRGTVQRVDMPALETQLKTATLEERINLYLENSIWYDAPTDLAKIRERPQVWRNLLKAMGLEQLAQEAIAGSVVPIEKAN